MNMINAPARSPVYFVSLGCPKNLVDSQVMLGQLEGGRYTIAREPGEAEVIIVNTCSFIQAAKEESIETILELAEHKQSGKCKVLVASGCLPQRYSNELEKEMPEVDLFIGTGQYQRITELLNERARARELGSPLPRRSYVDQPAFIHTERDARTHTGPRYSAFLKLSEGCNRRCAFCIIPKLRGNVRSRSVESLVEEARGMASKGVKEICLVAQDLTEYGMEYRYRKPPGSRFDARLEALLPELAKVEGVEWIRLHYVYPDQFSDELIDVIAREPKIVKYLDMPIQHTVDRVLRSMNRRLTKRKLFDLVATLRGRVPGIVFRTSIIVGFPGETEADFTELLADLARLDLDHVGVFRYSREEGTAAASMAGQVHPSTKRKREKALRALLGKQAARRAAEMVGRRVQVMIEGPSAESDLLIQGRIATQAQEIDGGVLINDLGDALELGLAKPGEIVEAEITQAEPLLARVVARRMMSPAATAAGLRPS